MAQHRRWERSLTAPCHHRPTMPTLSVTPKTLARTAATSFRVTPPAEGRPLSGRFGRRGIAGAGAWGASVGNLPTKERCTVARTKMVPLVGYKTAPGAMVLSMETGSRLKYVFAPRR